MSKLGSSTKVRGRAGDGAKRGAHDATERAQPPVGEGGVGDRLEGESNGAEKLPEA